MPSALVKSVGVLTGFLGGLVSWDYLRCAKDWNVNVIKRHHEIDNTSYGLTRYIIAPHGKVTQYQFPHSSRSHNDVLLDQMKGVNGQDVGQRYRYDYLTPKLWPWFKLVPQRSKHFCAHHVVTFEGTNLVENFTVYENDFTKKCSLTGLVLN